MNFRMLYAAINKWIPWFFGYSTTKRVVNKHYFMADNYAVFHRSLAFGELREYLKELVCPTASNWSE